jgi:PAS domain S-box-containing protein
VLYANPAAITLFGARTAQDLTGKPFVDLIHPDFRHVALAGARKAIETRTPLPMVEEELLILDGSAIPVEVQSTVIDYDGKPAILVSMHDISERKRAAALQSEKQSAEQAQAVAEAATQAKDHFLAVLSHELRNPLAPVFASVQLMQHKPNLGEDLRRPLEIIYRNAKLLAHLIDDLLDLNRIVRGKLDLRRKPVDIATVIEHAVEVRKPDMDARKLHFGIEMDGGPYWVHADAARLEQVIWNLLGNAVKFTPEGGHVAVRCYRREKNLVIEVVDSGVGIEPETANRIFDAFEQGGSAVTRKYGGLGLGLAIAKRLVEMHDGTISAHSEGTNKGSTLQISLPLVFLETHAEAAPQATITTVHEANPKGAESDH